MTDVLNTFANDGSDNEDIKKLFPKCKPKALGDINLNKLRGGIDKFGIAITNSNSIPGSATNTDSNATNGHCGRDTNGNLSITPNTVPTNTGNSLVRRHWLGDPMLNSLVFTANQNERALSRGDIAERRAGFKDRTAVGRSLSTTTTTNTTATSPVTSVDNHTRSANPEVVAADPGGDYSSALLEEDYSVLSAYEHHNMDRNSTTHHHPHHQQQHHHHHHRLSVSERPTSLSHVPSPPPVEDEVLYDDSLDIGYRVPVLREEFRLRESRIEIAGGREVFSSSRSRPAKKRFSDEILYHRPTDKDLKRHSGEVLYDDQSSRYHVKSVVPPRPSDDLYPTATSSGANNSWSDHDKQQQHGRRHPYSNKIVCDVDEMQKGRGSGSGAGVCAPQDVDGYYQPSETNDHGSTQQQQQAGPIRQSPPKETFVLKGQRSGMFIYETVVCGTSEVVYDDIGDWNEQRAFEEKERLRRNSFRHLQIGMVDGVGVAGGTALTGSSDHIGGYPGGQGGGGSFQQKSHNASTEAVNSEDFMSEREDGGSSQEETLNHVMPRGKIAGGGITSAKLEKLDGSADAVVAAVAAAVRYAEQPSSSDDMDTESAQSSPDRKTVAKLIGNLPIAQYEGSPRRYGPRPGHSQRITDIETTTTTVTTVFDVAATSLPPTTTTSNSALISLVDATDNDVTGDDCTNHVPSLQSSTSIEANGQPVSTNGDEVEAAAAKGETSAYAGFPFPLTDYNYLYEESETRKVLEEFYRQDGLCTRLREGGTLTAEEFRELEYRLYRVNTGNSYVGRRLAQSFVPDAAEDSPKKKPPPTSLLPPHERMQQLREHILASSLAILGGAAAAAATTTPTGAAAEAKRESTLSKENIFNFNLDMPLRSMQLRVPDQDGDTVSTNPDTEDLGETEIGEQVGQSRNFTLSPETTECDSSDVESEVSLDNEGSLHSSGRQYSRPVLEDGLSSGHASEGERERSSASGGGGHHHHHHRQQLSGDQLSSGGGDDSDRETASCEASLATLMMKKQISEIEREIARRSGRSHKHEHGGGGHQQHFQQPHVQPSPIDYREVEEYLRRCDSSSTQQEAELDLEMLERLRTNSQGTPPPPAPHPHRRPSLHDASLSNESVSNAINEIKQAIRKTKSITLKSPHMEKPEEDKPVWVMRPSYKTTKDGRSDGDASREKGGKGEEGRGEEDECDTDQETDRLLGKQRSDDTEFFDDKEKEAQKKKGRTKEVLIHEPAVLIEGVLFRARYLGSTQLACEGQPTKATRMMQAEEAVSRIKAPDGETQPSTEVDLFISTEKIMVLNTDLKEIMMDHALRTISYIADIGDLVVLMARRRMVSPMEDPDPKIRRSPKMICHVFESEEAQFIAQSIGQAFQVAYMEFLKANGIEDHSFVKEMDYQEVLNSQEIFGDELEMFAKKEMQKEVIVPKLKGEILGVVIVESGWGSMLPTVVIANLSPSGAAARCGQLNIGDQIIAINGISLVGLPLSTCQNYIKNTKNQTVVKLTVVPCAPVVEVKIKRPDTKYQLGFSVQNGVICSLLRGGIAERGGVRVGHRIIEINGQSVVAVPHERIVNLLATSVGEIHMKTMPTSMFRLLTGQEAPLYI